MTPWVTPPGAITGSATRAADNTGGFTVTGTTSVDPSTDAVTSPVVVTPTAFTNPDTVTVDIPPGMRTLTGRSTAGLLDDTSATTPPAAATRSSVSSAVTTSPPRSTSRVRRNPTSST